MAAKNNSNQPRTNQQPTKQPFSLEDALAALEAHGCTVQQANGGWKAQCPAHEDRTPSLSVHYADASGKVLLKCHAGCTYPAILAALGLDNNSPRSTPAAVKPNGTPNGRKRPVPRALPSGKSITVYHYEDAEGAAAFAVVRKDTSKGKVISQWTPSGEKGLWESTGLKGKRPLYRLPELLESDGKVVIVEGEKCVEAGRKEQGRKAGFQFLYLFQRWKRCLAQNGLLAACGPRSHPAGRHRRGWPRVHGPAGKASIRDWRGAAHDRAPRRRDER